MLFSYKIFIFSQPFSQHPNKFYYRKFQNIHLTKPKIKIKTLSKRKKEWDRREKEWQIEGKRDRSGKREIIVDGGQWRPDRVGLGVEWSGLVVGGDQIDDVEQEAEQDQCVENELDLRCVEKKIGFRWIDLGWWRSRWQCQWVSSGDYGCDLINAGVQSWWCYRQRDLDGASGSKILPVLGCDEISAIWGWGRWCDLGLLLVRPLLVVSLSLSLFYFPGVEIIWR